MAEAGELGLLDGMRGLPMRSMGLGEPWLMRSWGGDRPALRRQIPVGSRRGPSGDGPNDPGAASRLREAVGLLMRAVDQVGPETAASIRAWLADVGVMGGRAGGILGGPPVEGGLGVGDAGRWTDDLESRVRRVGAMAGVRGLRMSRKALRVLVEATGAKTGLRVLGDDGEPLEVRAHPSKRRGDFDALIAGDGDSMWVDARVLLGESLVGEQHHADDGDGGGDSGDGASDPQDAMTVKRVLTARSMGLPRLDDDWNGGGR